MREGEAIFDELRSRWERQLGADELATLEKQLAELVGARPVRFDTPGWIATDLGGWRSGPGGPLERHPRTPCRVAADRPRWSEGTVMRG